METFSTLGDLLLRRYVTDYIGQMQQLSAPVYSQLKVNTNFTPSGAGASRRAHVKRLEIAGTLSDYTHTTTWLETASVTV